MDSKEVAIRLTEIINENTNEYGYGTGYLTEQGVINTYKRVLAAIESEGETE